MHPATKFISTYRNTSYSALAGVIQSVWLNRTLSRLAQKTKQISFNKEIEFRPRFVAQCLVDTVPSTYPQYLKENQTTLHQKHQEWHWYELGRGTQEHVSLASLGNMDGSWRKERRKGINLQCKTFHEVSGLDVFPVSWTFRED